MGLGGYLTWTAALHEIHKCTGKRCVPGERQSWGFFSVSSPIWKNNPDISLVSSKDALNVSMNAPVTNYCKHDTPDRAFHRHDKHMIFQILEGHDLGHLRWEDDVRPRLYFDDDERSNVDHLLRAHDLETEKFVVIEPNSNREYTVNREYPFEKWQAIVDALKNEITFVQVGTSTSRLLNDVVDLRGLTTFRTAAAVIERSKALFSTEGGLVHAAAAFKRHSIVVITGYEDPTMVAYPWNTNLWIHGDHGPCGLKKTCQECWNQVSRHDPQEIVDTFRKAR